MRFHAHTMPVIVQPTIKTRTSQQKKRLSAIPENGFTGIPCSIMKLLRIALQRPCPTEKLTDDILIRSVFFLAHIQHKIIPFPFNTVAVRAGL